MSSPMFLSDHHDLTSTVNSCCFSFLEGYYSTHTDNSIQERKVEKENSFHSLIESHDFIHSLRHLKLDQHHHEQQGFSMFADSDYEVPTSYFDI